MEKLDNEKTKNVNEHMLLRRNWCVTNYWYWPTDLYQTALQGYTKSLTSLQFDVICCAFISSCERCSLCTRKKNEKLGLGIVGQLGSGLS